MSLACPCLCFYNESRCPKMRMLLTYDHKTVRASHANRNWAREPYYALTLWWSSFGSLLITYKVVQDLDSCMTSQDMRLGGASEDHILYN